MMVSIEFLVFIAAAFIFLAFFILKSMYLVRQAEAVIIERFGKFHQVLHAGLHFVVPFIESARPVAWTTVYHAGAHRTRALEHFVRIDLREKVYDFPKQNVITRDNVTIEIDALIYYQITDPRAAVYEVANLSEAIEKLAQTTLRNIIGSMDLDETLVSRDMINEKLRIILDEATDKWGVKVNRVELQEVNPPHDIRIAMEKQMRAERDRRATILESEGKKSAAILEAEGIQLASILRAEGEGQAQVIAAKAEAEAKLRINQAEAQTITMIKEVSGSSDPLAYMIALQYIKMLPELAKDKNDKLVLVPYEAASLMGAVSAIKKVFQE